MLINCQTRAYVCYINSFKRFLATRFVDMAKHTLEIKTLDEVEEDRVRKMYANRNILITGGTGFLGKVMIEKFLR